MIQAGKLRQHADLEHFAKTSTGDRGQPVGSWVVLYYSVPMELVPLSGRQLEIARQLVATATHRANLRYHASVTAGMRLVYQGRHFAIGWVGEGDFRKHDMHFLVTEQTTGAT